MTLLEASSAVKIWKKPMRSVTAASSMRKAMARFMSVIVPPLITIALLLAIWQLLCSGPGASLPPPTKVVHDTWELISDPFFDHGGTDVGLFWQILASLKRVGIGFGLAAVSGIALGVLVGQSTFAHRGLDPIFQVLRTVPPLAWLPISLAAFKDANPSAIFVIYITAIWPIILNTAVGIRQIPQDYRNIARVLRLNGFEYFNLPVGWPLLVCLDRTCPE